MLHVAGVNTPFLQDEFPEIVCPALQPCLQFAPLDSGAVVGQSPLVVTVAGVKTQAVLFVAVAARQVFSVLPALAQIASTAPAESRQEADVVLAVAMMVAAMALHGFGTHVRAVAPLLGTSNLYPELQDEQSLSIVRFTWVGLLPFVLVPV